MTEEDISHLKSRVNGLISELHGIGPVMRGSVTEIGNKNKQPHFSVSIKGKTKLIYLGAHRVAKAQAYSDNYRRLMGIIQEMTLLNMEILKREGLEDKNKK